MAFDLIISPVYRVGGREQPSLPGLIAGLPPRRAARGREQDRLIVYLQLTGRAVLTNNECIQTASRAAVAFYNTSGTVTSAMRAAAASVNDHLRERNSVPPSPGAYTLGLLALCVLRGNALTLLFSGPMQALVQTAEGPRHILDAVSGRGLGLSDRAPEYLSQVSLAPGSALVLTSHPAASWAASLSDSSATPLDLMRRRLLTATAEDVSAVYLRVEEGDGIVTVHRPAAPAGNRVRLPRPGSRMDAPVSPSPEVAPQPSAYAIPPQAELAAPEMEMDELQVAESTQDELLDARPRTRSQRGREAAQMITGAIRTWRKLTGTIGGAIARAIPQMLPGTEPDMPWRIPQSTLTVVAVLVPLIVVAVASAAYFTYGRSVQYEQYLALARNLGEQAAAQKDPSVLRTTLQQEIFYLDKAESSSATAETRTLRADAQKKLDELGGTWRLSFRPVMVTGVGFQIGRLAASENDVYALDAQRGSVSHIALMNGEFRLDTNFSCAPGTYGSYTVGPLVDIVTMPAVNTINASVMGMDAAGNLLYCAPGQLAQALPLPPPDTNWGRVKAFTIDSGNLYVLDPQQRAVWVYVGKSGTFTDRPYFFFGTDVPKLDDAIDLAVSADDLYVLHADGHLSTCSYSNMDIVPTRCQDPANLVNPFPAYQEQDLFAAANFTQMLISPSPDSSLLLLDAEQQGVFRFALRSLELQRQLRALVGQNNLLASGAFSAMAISSNHFIYVSIGERIYFAPDTPAK